MRHIRNATDGGRRSSGFCRAETGAASVEFALIVAPFLILLMVLIELGFMLQTESNLQNATEEAGRLIRTGQVTSRTGGILMNSTTFIEKLCSQATVISKCAETINLDVQSKPSFGDLAAAVPAPITVGPATQGGGQVINFQPGGAGKPTSVIVTYDWSFRMPFMKVFGNVFGGAARRLQAVAVLRNEPY